MSINYNDIVRQGYVKMKSKNLGRWIKRWVRLHRMSSKGHNHIEKYLNEEAAKNGAQHKIIDLKDVKSIERLPCEVKKHGVEIKFNDESSRHFACGSDMEASEWMKDLEQLCLGGVPNISLGEPDILEAGMQREMNERYHVYLLPASNLDLCGECLLQVTLDMIILWDVDNPRRKLIEWPVSALRRYGGDSSKFTFEAGRHCKTGEGVYVVNTISGEEIYTKVNDVARAIALSARHNRHTAPQLALDRDPIVEVDRQGFPRSHSLPPPPRPDKHEPTGLSGYIHPPGPSSTLPVHNRWQHGPSGTLPAGIPHAQDRWQHSPSGTLPAGVQHAQDRWQHSPSCTLPAGAPHAQDRWQQSPVGAPQDRWQHNSVNTHRQPAAGGTPLTGQPYFLMKGSTKSPRDLMKAPEEDEGDYVGAGEIEAAAAAAAGTVITTASSSSSASSLHPVYMNMSNNHHRHHNPDSDEDEDYVPYEQRGLSETFRNFLTQRQSVVLNKDNQIMENITEEQL